MRPALVILVVLCALLLGWWQGASRGAIAREDTTDYAQLPPWAVFIGATATTDAVERAVKGAAPPLTAFWKLVKDWQTWVTRPAPAATLI